MSLRVSPTSEFADRRDGSFQVRKFSSFIQKWSRKSKSNYLRRSSCIPSLNPSVRWNYGLCSENLNHPIITHVEVEGEIVELPASIDFPILSLNRWVSHLCQAALILFIEFFTVAVAAWGFTVISFHNCMRIPLSPTRFFHPRYLAKMDVLMGFFTLSVLELTFSLL